MLNLHELYIECMLDYWSVHSCSCPTGHLQEYSIAIHGQIFPYDWKCFLVTSIGCLRPEVFFGLYITTLDLGKLSGGDGKPLPGFLWVFLQVQNPWWVKSMDSESADEEDVPPVLFSDILPLMPQIFWSEETIFIRKTAWGKESCHPRADNPSLNTIALKKSLRRSEHKMG